MDDAPRALRMAIDVGNTEIVVGLFRGRALVRHWRVATAREKTADEYRLLLRGLLTGVPEVGDDVGRLSGVIGSVVPPLDRTLTRAFHAAFGTTPILINDPRVLVSGSGSNSLLLDVDDPSSVGADRVLNTLAVSCLYAVDTIVVDLGTATTFDCITGEGTFLGGVIAPGPRAGVEGLAGRTSKLPFIELAPPERVIGRRTEACLRSGCFYAIVDGIDGMVGRIRGEWEAERPLVVATGGVAPLIAPYCRTIDLVEPHLTLYGLEIAQRRLKPLADT